MSDTRLVGSDLPGIKLRHSLFSNRGKISQIVWSPDGHLLASLSNNHSILLWDTEAKRLFREIQGNFNYSIAWSSDGQILASASDFKTIQFWEVETGRLLWELKGPTENIKSLVWAPTGWLMATGSDYLPIEIWNVETGQSVLSIPKHFREVISMAWSPNGQILASGTDDKSILLWEVKLGQQSQKLVGHSGLIRSLAWARNGQLLASASNDQTIRIWEAKTGRQIRILEGHTSPVVCISFSSNGELLVSKSLDGITQLWRSDTWDKVARFNETFPSGWGISLAFHPNAAVLATLGEEDGIIQIWDLDNATILDMRPILPSLHHTSITYTNAKVVLVGDSGVGKSGLGLVLSGQPFVPTESTHGRNIWKFTSEKVGFGDGHEETREILLWDLAGQPGYRLIHQLHLNEVVVALVIIDSHSETDPFAGVYHWVRALRMAERVQGNSALLMKKFLIAARIDRGGKSVSRGRIDSLVRELGFDGYFETSAKEGQNITNLIDAIKGAIDWWSLPKVTSTDLFQHIRTFLVKEKEDGRLLSTFDDLYRAFLKSEKLSNSNEDLSAEFGTCIGRVEAQGLIRQLSFGKLVLLQPELLDKYASALINAVRDEPDGLGSMAEEKIQVCNFPMPKDERIADREQEKLLLIAMSEDLLRYDLALREQGEDGAYLIFPSQSTRENPDLPDAKGKAVIFIFEGPVQNIYATLAVRLSHSGLFIKQELWKNAVTYTTKMGGTYGIFLQNIGEGRAKLTVFFDKIAREETRFHFKEFVKSHLQRRALTETVQERQIVVCIVCGTPLDDLHVRLRQERGFNWILCNVCDTKVSLMDTEEPPTIASSSFISEMDRSADNQREREAAKSTVQGKRETKDFDAFLCYHNIDKHDVRQIGEQLKDEGYLPWLDEWELMPGRPWQPLLEKQIRQIKSAVVFVGKNGIGPWQQQEINAFLREFVRRGCPVIPVLLANASKKPKLPLFLEGMVWVDFRKQDPNPMEQLIWGITGKRGAER